MLRNVPNNWGRQRHISRHFIADYMHTVLRKEADLKAPFAAPPHRFTRTSHIDNWDHITNFQIQLVSSLKSENNTNDSRVQKTLISTVPAKRIYEHCTLLQLQVYLSNDSLHLAPIVCGPCCPFVANLRRGHSLPNCPQYYWNAPSTILRYPVKSSERQTHYTLS